MASKPWLYPAPSYRALETYWDTDDDAPGPRCGHTLTAVAATKSFGPRLILFGGATAIEGGASSAAPGISNCSLSSPWLLWLFLFLFSNSSDGVDVICADFCPFERYGVNFWILLELVFWCFCYQGLAGVTNSVHSYDVLTRKWTRYYCFCTNTHLTWFFCFWTSLWMCWLLMLGCLNIRIRPAGEPPSPRAAHAAAAVGTMVVFQVIEWEKFAKNWNFWRFLFMVSQGGTYVNWVIFIWLGWHWSSWAFHGWSLCAWFNKW